MAAIGLSTFILYLVGDLFFFHRMKNKDLNLLLLLGLAVSFCIVLVYNAERFNL